MHQKVGRVLEVGSAVPQRVSRDALIRAGRGVEGSGLIARCVERLLEDAAQYPAGKKAGWNGCGWGEKWQFCVRGAARVARLV